MYLNVNEIYISLDIGLSMLVPLLSNPKPEIVESIFNEEYMSRYIDNSI